MPKSKKRARSGSRATPGSRPTPRRSSSRAGPGLSAAEKRTLTQFSDWCDSRQFHPRGMCEARHAIIRGLFTITRWLGHGLTLVQPDVRALETLLDQLQLIVEPDGRTILSSDGQVEIDMSEVIDSLEHYLVFRIGVAGWYPPDGYLASFTLLDDYADEYADDVDDSLDSFYEDAYEISHSEPPDCERDIVP